jgi:hypothetical protein
MLDPTLDPTLMKLAPPVPGAANKSNALGIANKPDAPGIANDPKAPSTTPTAATSGKPSAQNHAAATPNRQAANPGASAMQTPAEADVTIPHLWSTNHKAKLLELLATETAAGHATDNGNLKKEGWTNVMNTLNEYFSSNLNREKIKNQKNVLCSLYADYKFLCGQSGFGWDNEKCTVTADPKTWDELILAHPRRNFKKLKEKPFPLFNLAKRVFTGTYATGKVANSLVPPTEDPTSLPKSIKKKK